MTCGAFTIGGLMTKLDILRATNFGQRVAEDEIADLASYFVETDQWRRVFAGEIDIVYGGKGTGKSGIYALLISRSDDLFDRSIILAPAENPRGTPAFKDLVLDPPTTEAEFVGLWKLYLAAISAGVLEEFGLGGPATTRLRDSLAREGLIPAKRDLAATLRSVFEYAKRALRPTGVEGGLLLDPVTGMPSGFTGRILFQEPTNAASKAGFRSVDHLLSDANEALAQASYSVWLLLDRLDVAFAESPELEQNALRAVFKVYLDLMGMQNLRLKIFLRSDIWRRITMSGFREASHITRNTTIAWDRTSLLNLMIRRLVKNPPIVDFYGADPAKVLASTSTQEGFFERVFPAQVDVGPNKPSTLDWVIGRTRDASGSAAPREVIHLLNALREVQVRRLEAGESEPEGEQLFLRPAFKEALAVVSRVRVEQTLFAEYPWLREKLDALRKQKTLQTPDSLAALWECSPEEAASNAAELVQIGFFEQRGSRSSPEYWVPFLFRDGLELVQGAAD